MKTPLPVNLAPLPPDVNYGNLIKEIAEANRVMGGLTGLLANIPNPALLISPLLTKEAVASSKIEGTQATLDEVYKYEAEGKETEAGSIEQDIREIINYRRAIQHAIKLLQRRPIGENFIKQLHAILLDSVRGTNKDPGHFRRLQVYIGKPGASVEDALFVPPAPGALPPLVSNWEHYVNSLDKPDILVQAAIAHYQFEAIHPFLDGNGRIGRLIIPVMLYSRDVLSYPLLYLSEYFESNRDDYYAHLRKVDQEQDWESWIRYFLISVREQGLDTQQKIMNMLDLYKEVKNRLLGFTSQYSIALLDLIFESPVISFKSIKSKMGTKSNQTIYNLIAKFEQERILFEITGNKRNRIYAFEELLSLLR